MKPNKEFWKYYLRVNNISQSGLDDMMTKADEELYRLGLFVQAQCSEMVYKATGPANIIDYTKLLASVRGTMAKIETEAATTYAGIGRSIETLQKSVFLDYRKALGETLDTLGIDVTTLKEAEEDTGISVTFRTSPTDGFKKQMNKMLQAGTAPALRIKTIGQDHVTLVQHQMSDSIAKGKGFGWVADEVLKKMYPGGVEQDIRKRMKYNIERIARTSYRDALNNDTMDFISKNSSVFYGARRTADGRPCIACIVRDGEFIPPGKNLSDHPNGQCIAVPLTWPVQAFMKGHDKTIWPKDPDGFGPTLLEKFYSRSEGDQRKVLGRGIYNLWKEKQFDLRQIINPETSTPRSMFWVVSNLEKIGAQGSPQCWLAEPFRSDVKFIDTIDAYDRSALSENLCVVTDTTPFDGLQFTNQYGMNPFGTGEDMMASTAKINLRLRSELIGKYRLRDGMNVFDELHWSSFNEYARSAGLFVRKSVNGYRYYMVPAEDAVQVGLNPWSAIGKKVLPTPKPWAEYNLQRPYTNSREWKHRFAKDVNADDILKNYEPQFAAQVEEKRLALKANKTTKDIYKKDGIWDPERVRTVHKDVYDKYLSEEAIARATPKAGEAPQYVTFGGRGGSGKGSFTKSLNEGGLEVIDKDRFIILDSDAIKEMLPEYKGWNAFLLHDEASFLFDDITSQARRLGLNIVHDSTLKTPVKALAAAEDFLNAGYELKGYYMHLPPQDAAHRAILRFYNSKAKDFSGRFVPPEVVLGMQRNEESFDLLKRFFTEWKFFDNQGKAPILVADGSRSTKVVGRAMKAEARSKKAAELLAKRAANQAAKAAERAAAERAVAAAQLDLMELAASQKLSASFLKELEDFRASMPDDIIMLHTPGGEKVVKEFQHLYQSTYKELMKTLGLDMRNTSVVNKVEGTVAKDIVAAPLKISGDMAEYGFNEKTFGLYKLKEDEIIVSLNNNLQYHHRVHTMIHETTHSVSAAYQRNSYWHKPFYVEGESKLAFLKTRLKSDFDLFTEGLTDLYSNAITYRAFGVASTPESTTYATYINKMGNAMFTVCGGDAKAVRRLSAEIANWGKNNYKESTLAPGQFVNQVGSNSIFELFYKAYIRAGGKAMEPKKFNSELNKLFTQGVAEGAWKKGSPRLVSHELTKFWVSKSGNTNWLTNDEMYKLLAETF